MPAAPTETAKETGSAHGNGGEAPAMADKRSLVRRGIRALTDKVARKVGSDELADRLNKDVSVREFINSPFTYTGRVLSVFTYPVRHPLNCLKKVGSAVDADITIANIRSALCKGLSFIPIAGRIWRKKEPAQDIDAEAGDSTPPVSLPPSQAPGEEEKEVDGEK